MADGSLDLVQLGDAAPSPSLSTAIARARLDPVLHRIATPEAGVALRFVGDALIVAAPACDPAVGLMLAEMRRRVAVRIILLSPALTADERIRTLMLGVDHVLAAEVDERELAAVLRNAVRRPAAADATPRADEAEHRWRLEADRWTLVAPNAREVRVTHSEYAVLARLLDHAGTVQSRAELMAAIGDSVTRERVLDVLISKLRRKVWDCAAMELPLRSARNAGYVFAGRVADAIPRD